MKYTRHTLALLGLTGSFLIAQEPTTPPPAPTAPAAPTEAPAALPATPGTPAAAPAIAPTEAPPAAPAAPTPPTAPTPPSAPDAPKQQPEAKPEAKGDPKKEEQERLTADNALAAERLKAETNDLRSEITRLKMEKELLTERLSLNAIRRQVDQEDTVAKIEQERSKFAVDAELARSRAEYLTNELKAAQAQAGLQVTKLQNEIAAIEMEAKRKDYIDAKPQYLENPLQADGTLVISDRRIPLNGPISMSTADRVTERIDFYNNADKRYPIFIVIDQSPGGSVMAGYQILKAMESSDAPVYVVVKSFAASMAAGITTLAKQSYAYPNAIILHHQISNTLIGTMNLTQQAEMVKESQRWWTRLAEPVAKKMGITTDEFIKEMYSHSSSGDWSEFGEQAKDLKWVDHIVKGVEETSFTKNPDSKPPGQQAAELKEELDANGRPFSYLPRLMPKDAYYLYNPDGYYRVR